MRSYTSRNILIVVAATIWMLLATCGCVGGPYLQVNFTRGNSVEGENNVVVNEKIHSLIDKLDRAETRKARIPILKELRSLITPQGKEND